MLPPPTASEAVSWRPGAAAARVEQLGQRVDARVTAVWGEPATTAMSVLRTVPTAAETTASVTATMAPMRALPVPARIDCTDVRDARACAAGGDRTGAAVAVRAAAGRRASGAGDGAVAGASAGRGARPRYRDDGDAEDGDGGERAGARAGGADAPDDDDGPDGPTTTTAAPATLMAPTVDNWMAMTPATASAPGAIGRRAEQLGGVVGVRAAGLSIDFVDPARLSLLSGAVPAMPTVSPAAATPARDTIMPAARPLFATPAEPAAAPALTQEEWSLVATFPSAATALQLAAVRQSTQWSPAARAAVAPPRTMLAAIAAGEAPAVAVDCAARRSARPVAAHAARGGAPAEYVAPIVAAAETVGRLPGGWTPRGSFTWTRLPEFSSAMSEEWTAPASVTVAEHTRQAAPGTPLWGAMPPLVAVSPSVTASAARGG